MSFRSSGKRTYSASQQGPLAQHSIELELKPVTAAEEGGWQLWQGSKSRKLFWYHPQKNTAQWETPADVKPARWRMVRLRGGVVQVCNMETEELLPEAPQLPPQPPAMDNAVDWIEERGKDGAASWYNPRLGIVSLTRPPVLTEGTASAWQAGQDEHGYFYVQIYTRETVRRRPMAETAPKIVPDLPKRVITTAAADETRLGKQLVPVAPAVIDLNASNVGVGNMGRTCVFGSNVEPYSPQPSFSKALFQRLKFFTDFTLKRNADGSSQVVNATTGDVLCKVAAEHTDIYVHNEHLRQVFANQYTLHIHPREFTGDLRIVQRDAAGRFAPRRPYTRRQGEVKTVEFWYMRGWMMFDLEFLTLHGGKSKTVVMAFENRAVHVGPLATYFPALNFVAYGYDLDEPVPSIPNLEVRRRRLTEEEARRHADDGCLFIAHAIITEAPKGQLSKEMQWIEASVKAIEPVAASVTFQLPWPEKRDTESSSRFFDGELHFPIWSITTGTECQLFITDFRSQRSYNQKDYEEVMFYFNTELRTTYFPHKSLAEGMDHCYDCSAEIFLLCQYLEKHAGLTSKEDQLREAARLSFEINDQVSSDKRSLANWQEYIERKTKKAALK